MKSYPVGLVGEQHCQAAIRACQVGQAVRVCHEIGNPYDEDALVVVGAAGRIGYIARDSFLQGAIHEEGQGCSTRIKSIDPGGNGALQIVLDVQLNDDGCEERAYSEDPKPAAATRSNTASGAAREPSLWDRVRRSFGI